MRQERMEMKDIPSSWTSAGSTPGQVLFNVGATPILWLCILCICYGLVFQTGFRRTGSVSHGGGPTLPLLS